MVPASANPEREETSRRCPFRSSAFLYSPTVFMFKGLAMAKIIETSTGALALTFDDVLLQPGMTSE
ncbi:hypothetical protein ENZ75_33865, partial [Mesorhizobium sp. M7A.F.Ca.CA.002.04.1.1]|uniref:hypothetical protein n=1 Tax=Mesorhizobium sp. M7A.F.Ca.CA.002.04.1.1 TaxID=2496681 RepID=UPI000FD53F0E